LCEFISYLSLKSADKWSHSFYHFVSVAAPLHSSQEMTILWLQGGSDEAKLEQPLPPLLPAARNLLQAAQPDG
jgi:hypothetical protein